MKSTLSALAFVLLAAGCASVTTLTQGKGASALGEGVSLFEEGRYPEATKSLNTALELGLSSTADLARAHKYLAFIACVTNRVAQCREEFSRALDANPSLELDPSEVRHPIWGPVFKSVKSARAQRR